MLYVRVATGFVPGGPNNHESTTPADVPGFYGPSKTTNYEAGIKAGFFENHLNLDLSAFDVEWHDLQLLGIVGSFSTNVTGGGARSKGVEWSTTYTSGTGLSLGLNGAYTDAVLTQDTPSVIGGKAGQRLPGVPLWEGSASAKYVHPIFGNYSGYVGVDWRFSGKRFGDFEPIPPRQEIPSYNFVNFRVGTLTDKWGLAFYVKNVANKIAINYLRDWGSDGSTALQSASVYLPRTIGVEVTANY
jgi:hypothetical protein